MVDKADEIARKLASWASTVLPKVPVVVKPLSARDRDKGVDIRLIGLAPRARPRATDAVVVIDLDYLITAQMDDALAEQQALAELLLAATDRSDFEIVAGRPAAEICVGLGIAAGAGFVLRTALTRIRETKAQPLVRVPIKVETAELGVLEGFVLGPTPGPGRPEIPIVGAIVTVPGLRVQVRTDAYGRFRIPGTPRDGKSVKLNIKARGVELDAAAMPGDPIVLHLPLEV